MSLLHRFYVTIKCHVVFCFQYVVFMDYFYCSSHSIAYVYIFRLTECSFQTPPQLFASYCASTQPIAKE